ncbi:DUF3939 domain-containing protein [Amphibacillus sediminis]|uniref:DUF3939 domain-containing protein n=1 Tax=Amphibacillus sediminis TaxID=360185 RepID=UPI000834AF28|nr:DUF3939 domain-containing protein [Amphibacillus sediminis]
MWNPFKLKKKEPHYPVINVSLGELKHAIHEYTTKLPDDVPLSTLINEDLSINYQKLAPILKGIPIKTYYMSTETYEIFDEEDKHLAEAFDDVQRAVDRYIDLTNDIPVIHGDPYFKISYHKLAKQGLLDYRPHVEFYLSKHEHLITTKRPK